MIYLALSCLQGRPMQTAAEDLLSLGNVGLQLTPGNAPTKGFAEWLVSRNIQTRTHHGYSAHSMKQAVWGDAAECLVPHDSVHPPQLKSGLTEPWRRRLLAGEYGTVTMEVMYPGYPLGDGDSLSWAMDEGIPLAVDASHLHIQMSHGVLSQHVWQRLQNYPHIQELHLSQNKGDIDNHQPLTPDTFGLAWSLERAREGIPLILECYMHRLSQAERCDQLALLTAAAADVLQKGPTELRKERPVSR